MKVDISKKLYDVLKKHHKNIDYSLQCLVNSLDPEACKDVFKVLNAIDLGKEKKACELSDDTVGTINDLFGKCDRETVEVLIWISALLPEI